MKHNRAYWSKLAAWRELSPGEQAAIRTHAADCPACARRLALYAEQDLLLSGLTDAIPQATFADVRACLTRPAALAPQRAWAAALVVFLFLGLGGGAVAASGSSLPGGLLYPVKLGVEASQKFFASDARRQSLDVRFAEQRRAEAQRLLALGRPAQMDIEGSLDDVQGNHWIVSDLDVTVPREVWPGEPPESGTWVKMRVAVEGQGMGLVAMRVWHAEAAGAPVQSGQMNGTATDAPGLPPATPTSTGPHDLEGEQGGGAHTPTPRSMRVGTGGSDGASTGNANGGSSNGQHPDATDAPGVQAQATQTTDSAPADRTKTPTAPSGEPAYGGGH